MKKLPSLMLAVVVLFGVFGATLAKDGAQEYDGERESEGDRENPPYPDELLPDEDRYTMENEEAPLGAYAQTGASDASLSMPFIAKISIVLVVLIAAVVFLVLRTRTVPTS